MSGEAFVIFFLARAARRNFRQYSPDKSWDRALLYIMIGCGVLLSLEVTLPFGHKLVWLWHASMAVAVYCMLTMPRFQPLRTLVYAVLPFVILTTVEDIMEFAAPAFKKNTETYFGIVYTVAITWMVTLVIRSGKQNKALEKEREKAREEQQRARFMEAQKDELERIVVERTAEITQQKNELENALLELQAAQTQLIHSEKMASLGELTAGIAHEIQNPLNFVNNFSEVNNELLDEMESEIKSGNLEEAFDIAKSIRENGSKIIHHGRRADGIVKGMLQHSRASSGLKEPTDINSLADEYIRLSYHGLRAKDKSFNANIKTTFDEKIGKIMVIPQDIGRAFLNLFTNAFYAVADKKKDSGEDYHPTVEVTTMKKDDTVVIKVHDNGNGISERALDKIFQPFFTTKPTGQGTGLGLSLSYEIITQGHDGKIEVNTREGEFAEFIVTLSAVYNK